jgi:DNA replication protein DnaC
MVKKVATPKETAGGGFTFEDKVSASFLLKMLAGEFPLEPEDGQIEEVRFQKRVDGWYLDDLVLLLRRPDDSECTLAVSAKSNTQITKSGFPPDFRDAVWEQRLHLGTQKFDLTSDYLSLATSIIDHNVKTAWDKLLRKAIEADASEFEKRLKTPGNSNKIEQVIFESLNCPTKIDLTKTPADTTVLLKRLRHFQYDFESNPSDDENNCTSRCVQILRDGGQQQAISLWTQLKIFARELATAGGDLKRAELANRLRRRQFSLIEFPNYVSDWGKISYDFKVRIERVRDRLARQVELIREPSELPKHEQTITALVGASGSGKTVLAKQLATKAAGGGHAVWLTAADLNKTSITVQFAALGLAYSFLELVEQSIGKAGLIVIDSVERLDQNGLSNLAVLLQRSKSNTNSTAWSFVFTCVNDSWEHTLSALKREYSAELNVAVQTVEFRFDRHRDQIAEAFPTIAKMLLRPHLAGVFSNLKMLDLVVSNASEAIQNTPWVGETDILEWYWTQHIQKGSDGTARSRFLQKLACTEAERFLTAVPVGDFDNSECQLSQGLIADQVIFNRDERFGFEHDLFGDWSRARYLLSQQEEIVRLAKEYSVNPCWHRAIRLFGLRLLENGSRVEQWTQLIAQLSPDNQPNVQSDLILDSVALAGNAEALLRQVWPTLMATGGKLLRRLLTRFLHIATLPNPLYASETRFAALPRIPLSPYWLPMLRILFEKRAEALPIATNQITEIADLWLRSSRDNLPLRAESGHILLDAAQYIIEEIRLQNWQVDSKLCTSVFSRFLIAATVFPDKVSELALALVERRDNSLFASDKEVLSEESQEVPDEDGFANIFDPRGPLADPWPDGPLRNVNHCVHNGFLSDTDPLQHLFAVRPDVGKEVLLALLIREPLQQFRESFGGVRNEFLHVATKRDWCPPMYFRGPFLSFLLANREKGVETIVALLNFVTDRWIGNRDKPPLSIRISVGAENYEFFGSSDAYFWYRDSVHSPNVVVPALMALERWFYWCLENEETIAPVIQQILSTSRSTSLLGVLAAVGRKSPMLFNDELRALVPVWQLQDWEENYKLQQLESLQGTAMMMWSRWGESLFNLVQEWHTLDHRKTTIGEVLLQQFFNNADARLILIGAQRQWAEELENLGGSADAGFLEKIVIQFAESNWQMRKVKNGIAVVFEEPEERKQRLAEVRIANDKHIEVLTFPMYCRKMIDEKKVLAPSELEAFWARLKVIADDAEQARNRGDRPEDAIMGGIAVLELLHQEWIEADPEREEWCGEQFLKILENPPARPQFHIAESTFNCHWDNFAAMLIPSILAAAPYLEVYRSLCAEFALRFNYSVIKDLMASAFELRETLGDDFRRLQHLILVSSGIRNVDIETHEGNSFWGCPDIKFNIVTRYKKLIDQFTKASLSADIPSLCEIAEEATDTIVKMVQQQHKVSNGKRRTVKGEASIARQIKRSYGFEPMQLQAGFCWLKKTIDVNDPSKQAESISALANLLHGILRPLGGIDEALSDCDDNNAFFTFPHQQSTWIFQLIAEVIPKYAQTCSTQQLWEPILSYGLERVHWVESFISDWFIYGLRVEGCEDAFFLEWKAMIAFAWTKENWRKTHVRNHQTNDELFRYLMGLGNFGYVCFEDVKFRKHVASMKPEFQKWTDEFFPHPEAISAYALFLTYPSTIDYLREGIHKLAEVSNQFKDWYWSNSYQLEYALLKLLEHDWQNNTRLILSDVKVRQRYATLLKSMTDRQVPQALELQDRMLRAK